MIKYFKIHSLNYFEEKHYVSTLYDEDTYNDIWIEESLYLQWYNELELEKKDCELNDSNWSDRFCAEKYYGNSEDMFQKKDCNQALFITEEEIKIEENILVLG